MPYEAVYGKPPSIVTPYKPGATNIHLVDDN